MINYKLNIGEVKTSKEDVIYTCYGLGSCIGLFIKDRITGYSGGAHIFLPENEAAVSDYFYYSATHAIEEILRQMESRGSNLLTLRAKVAGGASSLGIMSVGDRNADSVVKQLVNRKIYIAAADLGGRYCRTARFESHSGLLTVSMPEIKHYKTY